MSLKHTVTAMVIERGEATARELAPCLPGYTDKQIRNALANAAFNGMIATLRQNRVEGTLRARESVYGPPICEPCRIPLNTRIPPSSVWDYAQRSAAL